MKNELTIERMIELENVQDDSSLNDIEKEYVKLANMLPFDEALKYFEFMYHSEYIDDDYIYLDNMAEYFKLDKNLLAKRIEYIEKIRLYLAKDKIKTISDIDIERLCLIEKEFVDKKYNGKKGETIGYNLPDSELLFVDLLKRIPIYELGYYYKRLLIANKKEYFNNILDMYHCSMEEYQELVKVIKKIRKYRFICIFNNDSKSMIKNREENNVWRKI